MSSRMTISPSFVTSSSLFASPPSPSSLQPSCWSSSAVLRQAKRQADYLVGTALNWYYFHVFLVFEICRQRYILISREAHSKNFLLWNNISGKHNPNVCRACSLESRQASLCGTPTQSAYQLHPFIEHNCGIRLQKWWENKVSDTS